MSWKYELLSPLPNQPAKQPRRSVLATYSGRSSSPYSLSLELSQHVVPHRTSSEDVLSIHCITTTTLCILGGLVAHCLFQAEAGSLSVFKSSSCPIPIVVLVFVVGTHPKRMFIRMRLALTLVCHACHTQRPPASCPPRARAQPITELLGDRQSVGWPVDRFLGRRKKARPSASISWRTIHEVSDCKALPCD